MNKKRMICMTLTLLLLISVVGVFFTAPVMGEPTGEIYTTNEERTRKNHFYQGNALVFFTIELSPPDETLVTIRVRDEDYSLVMSQAVWTDDSGAYISANEGIFFNMIGQDAGKYYLNMSVDGVVVHSHEIHIYDEQDFSQRTTVMTTDEEYEEKDFFTEDDFWIYFRAELKDQHGWPPIPGAESIYLYVERADGTMEYIDWYNVGEDGVVEDRFQRRDLSGDCVLIVQSVDDEENARYTFTIMQISISIYPPRTLYTQGQTIEIRIESNYHGNIDVAIANSTGEPFRYMSGARWNQQGFTNGIWAAEYIIPYDEADGEYFILVRSAGEEALMSWENFFIKRYSIAAGTNKDVYLPGEMVDVHYQVINHLDGSEATGVTIEWMVEYRDEDNDWDTIKGTATDDSFSFTLPRDAMVNRQFIITIWANDTAGYEDVVSLVRACGHVDVRMGINKATYVMGESVFVDIETFAIFGGSSSRVSTDVELSLIRDGEDVEGFTYTLVTDRFGKVSHHVHLSGNLESGIYSLRANATWEDQWDVTEVEFEVIDEAQTLFVHLERDKGSNAYHPGEAVTVSYWITHLGRLVEDANVRFRVYSQEGTYHYGFGMDGTILFNVPEDFSDDLNLRLEVRATLDQDIEGFRNIHIPVSIGRVLLNPSRWSYEGDENVSFNYELVGITEEDVEHVEYHVQDSRGDLVTAGSVTGKRFHFRIPERPMSSYDVTVFVHTYDGYRLQARNTIVRVPRIIVEVSIENSKYTSNAFKPGDEITVSYRVVAREGEVPPETVDIFYAMGHIHGEVMAAGSEGSFTFEAPEVGDGHHLLMVEVNGQVVTKTIEIQSSPSFTSRRIIGGFGVSNLIMSILVLVALFMAAYSFIKLYEPGTGFKPGKKKELDYEEEDDVDEDHSEYIVEDGIAEPEDTWHEESQIEPEREDW